MDRSRYKIFSEGTIAGLTLPNRLVRSATWDPCIHGSRRMTAEVLELYRNLALGGVGMIITGGLPVYRERLPGERTEKHAFLYPDLRIRGLEKLARVVHEARPDCRIVAQLEVGYLDAGPSSIPTPFLPEPVRALSLGEIEQIMACFVEAIVDIREAGFDGVQLHAAHGGLLSRFLSPYSNRRRDAFGGSAKKRAHIVAEIISRVRKTLGDFPVLIKMNSTDYLEGGIDIASLPQLAREIVRAGVDAIELSGGMWECLFRTEEELGFRPVPAPESHTRIGRLEDQSYFLPYAQVLDVPVPLILVGGNRDVESLETILQDGRVDFIALCRPLIRQPDLPDRWKAGVGRRIPECVSCNSCIYAMYVHPGRREPAPVMCVCKNDRSLLSKAQRWLAAWREEQRL